MLRLPVSLQYFTAYSCWAPRSRSGRIPHRVPSRSLRVADTSTSNNTQAKASEIRQGIPSLRAPEDVKLVLAGTYVEVADFHSDRHGHTEATSQVPSGCPEIHCSYNWQVPLPSPHFQPFHLPFPCFRIRTESIFPHLNRFRAHPI